LTEGDDAKAMYWLVRGAVAVTSRDGESTYAELKPGAFFGEIGILMAIPRTATIVARTKCLLVVLKKEDLNRELPRFPDVERAIRDEAAERLSILKRKKQEKLASASQVESGLTSGRGEKRARENSNEDGDVVMSDAEDRRQNGVQTNKKRKSPSPSLVETPGSSALGDGLVNVRALLKELPLFSGLPPDMLHFLGLNAQPCTYPPFTDIIQQDSQGREVFFIVRGEVEVLDEKSPGQHLRTLANGAGRNVKRGSQVKARLKQGQYFGEVVSLSLAPRRTATVRSVSSVECLMITGDVLSNFWLKCPPDVRHQVEKTAKQRLRSGVSDGDVVMTDADSTPPIAQLAIAERTKSKGTRKKSVPKVTFTNSFAQNNNKLDPHKPTRIEDRPVIEPVDPDPFMNVDLDKSFNRSRRSSLAPPLPEGETNQGAEQHGQSNSSPPPRAATPSEKNKHSSAPLDIRQKPKRPNTLQRRPSEFSQGILPDNLLTSIFMHLELHELMRLRSVSLHWSKLLKETPELVRDLDLTNYNRIVTDEALVKSICPFVGTRPRVIDISNCFHISDEGFSALSGICGVNVTTWRMKSVWDITAQAVLEMANRAKSLEEVDLSNCRKVSDNLLQRVVGWVVQGSPHNNSHGRHAAARSVGAPVPNQPPPGTVFGCPKLRILSLSYCKHVTDRSMAHMAYHAASRLEQIDLTRCTTITDQGFQHWGQFQFSRLTKLCLADCTYLTDNAIVYLTNAAKGLRDLDLVRCSVDHICSSY
jgi:F-box/leucine-rich repeat protein 7